MDRAVTVASQVAPTDLSVLVLGESGVGKEVNTSGMLFSQAVMDGALWVGEQTGMVKADAGSCERYQIPVVKALLRMIIDSTSGYRGWW